MPACAPPRPERETLLADLRARIRALETPARRDGPVVCPLGVPAIDAALPEGGLAAGALHEIVAGDDADGAHHDHECDRAAASGFAAALLARLAGHDGTVLWCRRDRELYAPGLAAFGLDPARLILVNVRSDTDAFWAAEESLASGTPAAVLAEAARPDVVALRRLQLAAEKSNTAMCLMVPARGLSAASPAATRWRVAPGTAGPDTARWRLSLLKCRHGVSGEWIVEHRHAGSKDRAAGGFALVADVRDRPSGTGQAIRARAV